MITKVAAAAAAAAAAQINHNHKWLAAPCLTTHHSHSTPLGKKRWQHCILGKTLCSQIKLYCPVDAVRVSMKKSLPVFWNQCCPGTWMPSQRISAHTSEQNYTSEIESHVWTAICCQPLLLQQQFNACPEAASAVPVYTYTILFLLYNFHWISCHVYVAMYTYISTIV